MKHIDIFTDKKNILLLLLTLVLALSLTSCSVLDILEFQNEENTVAGTVGLSDRISEEAKNGAEEITLFIEDVSEDEIKNITDNMGLFWGSPTQYTIIKAMPEENTLKIKFFIEKSDNYYVVNSYLYGDEIPEGQDKATEIQTELELMLNDVIEDGMTDYEKELAIHDWLVKEIEYDDSIDAGSVENGSYGALVNKKTMCRGYAEAMKLISECCQLETKIIVGNATDTEGKVVGHAWNLININDKWYHLDVTYDDPIGDDSDNNHYFYFNLNDSDAGKDHEWDGNYFPECNNDSYMYYKKNDLYYADMSDFRNGIKEALMYDKPKYLEVLLESKSISESQLEFVFDVGSVSSISWTTYGSDPVIVCITPKYR